MLPRIVFSIAAIFSLMALPAAAHDYTAGALKIDHPWARTSAGDGGNSAAYMKITNSGDASDTLTGVKADIADHVMLHESRMEDGVMKMVHLEGVEVPAGGEAVLKPLGLHVMLMGLKRPLKEGESFPMTLVFAKQGDVPVEAKIEKGAPAGGEHHHH